MVCEEIKIYWCILFLKEFVNDVIKYVNYDICYFCFYILNKIGRKKVFCKNLSKWVKNVFDGKSN